MSKMFRQESRPESSDIVRSRIGLARERQLDRSGVANAHMNPRQIRNFCALEPDCRELLEQADDKLKLSARTHNGILKVARTIADLENSDSIEVAHLGEALAYRPGLSAGQQQV